MVFVSSFAPVLSSLPRKGAALLALLPCGVAEVLVWGVRKHVDALYGRFGRSALST